MNSRRSEGRSQPRVGEIKVPWLTPEDVKLRWKNGVLQTILAFPGDWVETGQELAIVILSPPLT